MPWPDGGFREFHPPPPATAQSESLARLLSSISTALLVVFLAAVVSAALPPRLLDPAWQLKLTSALINNGIIALLGFLLLPGTELFASWADLATAERGQRRQGGHGLDANPVVRAGASIPSRGVQRRQK